MKKIIFPLIALVVLLFAFAFLTGCSFQPASLPSHEPSVFNFIKKCPATDVLREGCICKEIMSGSIVNGLQFTCFPPAK